MTYEFRDGARSNEDWRTIPSHPEYEASDAGEIRRKGGQPLSLWQAPSGYMKATLWLDGRCQSRWAHRLVCEAFHGPAPAPKLDAAHWNGEHADNRPNNLRWATRKENEADKDRHGRRVRGELHYSAKLSAADVREIRVRAADLPKSTGGKKFKKGALPALAAEYGVTASCLRQILSGQRWVDL